MMTVLKRVVSFQESVISNDCTHYTIQIERFQEYVRTTRTKRNAFY